MWLCQPTVNHTPQCNFLRVFVQPSPNLKVTLPFLHWHFMDQKSPSCCSGNTYTCSKRANRTPKCLPEGHPRCGHQLQTTLNWGTGKSRWNSVRTKEITTGYQTLTYKSHQAIQCNPASERCHLQKMICAELYLCVTEILGNYWREG